MSRGPGETHQVTFEDAWQLWAEVESATGARVEVAIARPRQGKGEFRTPAQLCVRATRLEKGREKSRAEWCQIGGTRGARTVPAALVRALSALAARLEEETDVAVQQAAF